MIKRIVPVATILCAMLGCAPPETEGPVQLSEEEAQEVMNEVEAVGNQEAETGEN